MAITRALRSFTLQDTGSRLLPIICWSLRTILSMALSSHVSLKCLLALDAGCSSTAHFLPSTEGCPACRNVALGPGIGDSSLDIAEQYSCCTILSIPLPWDMAVIPALSTAGQHVSGTNSDVPCIASLGTWVQRSPHTSGTSLESWVRDSLLSCGLMSLTCLLSHGAEATIRLDDCPVLLCGGDTPRGLLPVSAVGSGSLALWELLFPH